MSQDDLTMLMLGMQVQCTDGSAGVLSGVAIDAPQHRIVDVLVEPRHHHELARWVPVAKVAGDGADRTSLQLNLTTDELRQERPAVELDLSPADESAVRLGDTPEDRELAHPYVGFTPVDGGHAGASKRPVAEDHAPEGDVELRRDALVASSDYEPLGEIRGFVTDPSWELVAIDLRWSHRLRDREGRIPITAIAAIEPDEVRLSVTRDAAHALGARS